MPLFNTSVFSNTLSAPDRAAQRKALVTPFNEFDGKPEDVLQHIARFTQRCKETGVVEDFTFIISENPPPSDVDLDNPSEQLAWFSDPRRFTYGNLLHDASQATLEKVQAARDKVRKTVESLTATPDPKKMPLTAQHLVSYQNRDWIYVLLMNVWSLAMQAIMNRYQEHHGQDGVVLWFCFLKEFAGTTTANVIQANAMLMDAKLQLQLFGNNILSFTNYVRAPIRCLLKAKEPPTCQHFISIFHACMDAPNEEFRSFVTTLYTDYRNDGPTKSFSMLQLLDQLDNEYNRISTLGRWTKRESPEILALTATISNLQAELSSVKNKCNNFQALIARVNNPNTPQQPSTKLQKPPPKKANEPEVTTFQNIIWKWCDKCFGGTWNRTHVTAEHVAGLGKRNKRRQNPNQNDPNTNNNDTENQANLAQSSPETSGQNTNASSAQANIATTDALLQSSLDFL